MSETMAVDWTKLFKEYKGKWVALKEDNITVISSGRDIKKVREDAIKKGFDRPNLFRVPTTSLPFIG